MDQAGGPESTKKARWSNDGNAAAALSGAAASAAARNNASFENYGYGNNSFNHQNILAQQAQAQAQQLYATPLSANGASNGQGAGGPQISPNTAAAFAQQQQQQQQQVQNGNPPQSPFVTSVNNAYGMANFGYGMGGMMGVPSMSMLGGFPYSPQIGSFQQVGANFSRASCTLMGTSTATRSSEPNKYLCSPGCLFSCGCGCCGCGC